MHGFLFLLKVFTWPSEALGCCDFCFGRAVRFNLCPDIPVVISTHKNSLGRTLGHADAAALTKGRINLRGMLIIDKRYAIGTGPDTGQTDGAVGRINPGNYRGHLFAAL